jgi:hypothetical protein
MTSLLASRVALANSRGLTTQLTQVVELGTPDATLLNQIDVVDDRGVKGKDSLNANAETRLANSNSFPGAAMLTGNHDAFKRLQTFFGLGFLDANVNTHRIAGLKLGNILPQLSIFKTV